MSGPYPDMIPDDWSLGEFPRPLVPGRITPSFGVLGSGSSSLASSEKSHTTNDGGQVRNAGPSPDLGRSPRSVRRRSLRVEADRSVSQTRKALKQDIVICFMPFAAEHITDQPARASLQWLCRSRLQAPGTSRGRATKQGRFSACLTWAIRLLGRCVGRCDRDTQQASLTDRSGRRGLSGTWQPDVGLRLYRAAAGRSDRGD